jgi:hypothetical protein
MPAVEAEVYFYSFLNLGTSCGGWLMPRPTCLTPQESGLVAIVQEAG